MLIGSSIFSNFFSSSKASTRGSITSETLRKPKHVALSSSRFSPTFCTKTGADNTLYLFNVFSAVSHVSSCPRETTKDPAPAKLPCFARSICDSIDRNVVDARTDRMCPTSRRICGVVVVSFFVVVIDRFFFFYSLFIFCAYFLCGAWW